jgi:hypothetical protein
MSVSKVGLGWDVGERNYTTLADWIAAKKATGVFEDAWCKGNLGGSFSRVTGTDFSAGALIYGDVVYDGTNHAELAFLPRRLAIASSGAQVIAQDLYVKHTDGGQYSVTTTNGHLVQRLYIEHNSTTGVNAAILFLQANGLAKNCVVKTTNPGNQYTIRTGGSGSAIENCIAIGGLNAAYSVVTTSTIKNTFAVGQVETTACQNYPNGLPPANINNASTDGTGGAVSLLNVDPYSVFADYDNGDYRIKLSSELGVNGVGAFFYDTGGGTAYEDTLSGASYSASVGSLVSTRGFNDTLNGISYSGAIGDMIAARGYASELNGVTCSATVGSLSSLRGYSSLLSAADYGAAIGNLISTLDGAIAYSDFLSGFSSSVALGDLVSSVQRSSILNGLAYGFSVGDLTASLGYSSALSGFHSSSSIGQLTSTVSGEVTVTIEGYTISFVETAVAAVYAVDSISVQYAHN